MNPLQILSVLSAVGTAIWSVLTWSHDQQTQRQLRRDQEAALYVNPYLLALQELQSRLYSILEEGELGFYKKEYPDQYAVGSPAAIRILYHLSQYFGWAHHTFRYGPYTTDPRVIELERKIGETLEKRDVFPGNAFRFTIDERVSLGNAVVRRVGEATAVLPVFESIPLYQFEKEIIDEQSEHAPLFQSTPVRNSLTAIDRADRTDTLEGRERLAVLQNLLVELLAYLESQEGFRVSIGELKKVKLGGAVPARMSPARPTAGRVLHQTRGRVRLKISRLKTDEAYADRLHSLLASMDKISAIRISPDASSVAICYSPDIPEAEFVASVMRAVEGASIPEGIQGGLDKNL